MEYGCRRSDYSYQAGTPRQWNHQTNTDQPGWNRRCHQYAEWHSNLSSADELRRYGGERDDIYL